MPVVAPYLNHFGRLISLFLLVCGWLAGGRSAQAVTVGSEALVLVNSASARVPDFRKYLQPYLENFGVPYEVVDVRTNQVGTNFNRYAVVIIGHSQFDANQLYFTAAEQTNLTLAVSNGVGLVNFDSLVSGSSSTTNYPYLQDIFGFSFTNNASGNNVSFPAPDTNSALPYITGLHTNTGAIILSNNVVLAGLVLPTNTTAVALCGGKPLVVTGNLGRGAAVHWASYDWMAVAVKGPMAGLDDLIWRSIVWAARKPFAMRGMPNHVVMRVDDVAGPTVQAAATYNIAPMSWVRIATETGFKPHLEVFFNCLDSAEVGVLRTAVTNGQASVSIHSQGCSGGSFFYFNHSGKTGWSDEVMAQNFAIGTQWFQSNGIPPSSVICPHYSELGTNIFGGLRDWGVEFISMEVVPGTVEYPTTGLGAPWLVAGPYRLYETPLEGRSVYPFFYADFLPIPSHPELDGQFFNCYTEVRDDSACGEWCADNNVASSIAMGVRQLKRSFDAMAMATLYTHDYYMYPIFDNNSEVSTAITTNNWRAILQGITNAIASYQPRYVTLDYACKYVRATRTSRITDVQYDPGSGAVSLTLTGRVDLNLEVPIYFGAGNAISNVTAIIAPFTNSTTVATPVVKVSPTFQSEPQAQVAIVGSDVVFAASCQGTAPIFYQWQFNQTNLAAATNPTLSLLSVQASNAGLYAVVVSNLVGVTTSSNAALTVIVPPKIIAEPQSLVALVGSDVTLTVSVEGSAPFIYLWQRDFTNYAFTTNAYLTLSNVQPADVGSFFVIITNAAGAVTSAVATVTITNANLVLPPPPLLTGQRQGDRFFISFVATPGYEYLVEYRNTLDAGSWLSLTNVVAAETNVTVSDAIDAAQKFYRVRLGGLSAGTIELRGSLQAGGFILAFNAITGRAYVVEYSGDSNAWQPLTNITAQSSEIRVRDLILAPQRFYRVRTSLQRKRKSSSLEPQQNALAQRWSG